MITVNPRVKDALRILAGDRNDAVLRLGVTPDSRHPGAGRLRYVVELEDGDPKDSDSVFSGEGLTVVVGQESVPYLDGLELDAHLDGPRTSFVFHNPQAQHSCRCGQTFVPEGASEPEGQP